MSKILTLLDYQVAASGLGVPVATVKAVTEVESNGSGFLSDGRVKVQYEPHVMYQQLTKHFGGARANAELAKHPDLVARKPGSYQSTDKEDKDMDRAATGKPAATQHYRPSLTLNTQQPASLIRSCALLKRITNCCRR